MRRSRDGPELDTSIRPGWRPWMTGADIADLAGLTLGRSSGNRIFIDTNAAGHGWFVDETPGINEEFILSRNGWVAKPNSAADGKMDSADSGQP